uniref:Mitochondrial ribosomal protein L24 n=1 Tax=Sphenodon punctatus TaxID=8508 RepID=A0A8D0G899_SPHPU
MRLTMLLAMAERIKKLPKDYSNGTYWSSADAKNPLRPNRRKALVEPMREEDWKVFRGDTVQILFGKDAGKQGLFCEVNKESTSIFVEGLNVRYEYVGQAFAPPGIMVVKEVPLLVRQVTLIDPMDRLPTEVEWRYTEEGERVRVSLRTGRIIPKPIEQRADGIIPEQWIDGPKDTSVENALEKTYVPSLKLFQEEITALKGIVETRRFRKSYWY